MIPYEFSADRFSRWMAYVLRHNPSRYGLTPDRHGYVELEAFLRVARQRYPDISQERLRELAETVGPSRFEVTGSQVRARYGHSIPAEPIGPPAEPPPFLYYGTEASRAEAILSEGLTPLDRRALHLSQTRDEAASIAQRKSEQPTVFRILAQEAHRAGIAFYQESLLYLVSHIPASFIRSEPFPEAADPTPSAGPA